LLTEFGDEKIKMLVILTDGRPTKPDSEAKVVEVVEQYLLQRNDIVINAAGIGEDVDERLLLKIVNNCRGNYTRVTDLKLLVEWYADLARDLKMISSLAPVDDFVPDEAAGQEPGGPEPGPGSDDGGQDQGS
jgi:hypothetical protein